MVTLTISYVHTSILTLVSRDGKYNTVTLYSGINSRLVIEQFQATQSDDVPGVSLAGEDGLMNMSPF
jgi:hypothetical protein